MVLGLKKQTAQSRKLRPGRRRQHVVSAVKMGHRERDAGTRLSGGVREGFSAVASKWTLRG